MALLCGIYGVSMEYLWSCYVTLIQFGWKNVNNNSWLPVNLMTANSPFYFLF